MPWYSDRENLGKVRTSVGESIHTYQYALSALNIGGASDQVAKGGPRWLSEVIAEFLNFQALYHAGLLSYDSERASTEPWGFVRHARYVRGQLADMETYKGFQGVRGNGYKFSLMAVELLAAHAGQRALLEFYGWMRPGTTGQEGFKRAFGITVEDFYSMFEAHRAAGFPEFPLPIDRPEDPPTRAYLRAPNQSATAKGGPDLPPFVVWDLGEGVNPEELEAVKEGIRIMYDFGHHLGLPEIEEKITLYLHHDFETIATTYTELSPSWTIESSRDFWQNAQRLTRTPVGDTSSFGSTLQSNHH